ncbi:unnamed protein product [Candidula unifasciata]|uniref:SHSP domain-containing protein n=1 Tax=Candidula unifasciata TaxID=100452 RepID=A0A8S3Z1M3_9EUPU|nr:unnamed protein product [Candidula unifasciata]
MALSAYYNYNPRDDYDLLQLVDDLIRPSYESRPLRALRRANDLAQLVNLRGDSEVRETDKEFCIEVDLSSFNPEEVNITTNDKEVCINAKHEERPDKHGYVCRSMTRKYTLPPGVDPKSFCSTMNNRGILRMTASKDAASALPREVPIAVEYKGS